MSMWDWIRDNIIGDGGRSAMNTGLAAQGFMDNLARSTAQQFGGMGSVTPKPPAMDNFYDEGSRFREARDQAARLNSPQSDMPSIADIMARLEQLQNPSRFMMSTEELMRQAQMGADAQYNPVIAQLRNAQRQAQTRGETNRQQLGEMFGQLSTSLQNDIAPLEAKNAQTKQATQDQFAQLKQSIGQTYDDAQRQQEEMMQRLNIQAAAPEVLGAQERDQAYFTNRASTDENTALTALDQESRGNVEYTRRGSEVARIEGTQRQADLMSRVQEVIDAYQNQIGANEAAKSSAVQKMFGELSGQAQDQAFKLADRDFNNYMQSIQLGRLLSNDQFSRLSKGGVTEANSLADVGGRAMSLGLPSSSAQRIQNVLSSTLSGDQRILGGLNPDTGQALNDYQMAQYVMEAGRSQGLSQAELNALQAIALEYFR